MDISHARIIPVCDEAIKENPSDSALAKRREELRTRLQKTDEEIARVDKLSPAAREPHDYAWRALSWKFKGEFDKAIADYTDAIRLERNRGQLIGFHEMRGLTYLEKGDYEKAIADLSAHKENLGSRAFAFFKMGEFEKALADFNEEIRQRKLVTDLRWRARTLRSMGRLDEALEDYETALSIADPSDNKSNLHAQRGETREDKGQLKDALSDFEAALALDAGNSDLEKAIARTKAKLAIRSGSQVIASTPGAAQPHAAKPKGRRIALVVGNSQYKNAPLLPNPLRDAKLIADAFKKTGFAEVTLQTDLTKEALGDALKKFSRAAQTADWAVVYFAGHGMEIGGINYLIPVDATLERDKDIEFEAVPLNQVLTVVSGASSLRLVVLDACRVNPFANSMKRQLTTRAVERGFTRTEPDPGTVVLYAAKDGEVASDGNGTNSPFSSAFAKNIQMPGVEISKVFRLVRDDVLKSTNRTQNPYTYGSLPGSDDFYFVDSK